MRMSLLDAPSSFQVVTCTTQFYCSKMIPPTPYHSPTTEEEEKQQKMEKRRKMIWYHLDHRSDYKSGSAELLKNYHHHHEQLQSSQSEPLRNPRSPRFSFGRRQSCDMTASHASSSRRSGSIFSYFRKNKRPQQKSNRRRSSNKVAVNDNPLPKIETLNDVVLPPEPKRRRKSSVQVESPTDELELISKTISFDSSHSGAHDLLEPLPLSDENYCAEDDHCADQYNHDYNNHHPHFHEALLQHQAQHQAEHVQQPQTHQHRSASMSPILSSSSPPPSQLEQEEKEKEHEIHYYHHRASAPQLTTMSPLSFNEAYDWEHLIDDCEDTITSLSTTSRLYSQSKKKEPFQDSSSFWHDIGHVLFQFVVHGKSICSKTCRGILLLLFLINPILLIACVIPLIYIAFAMVKVMAWMIDYEKSYAGLTRIPHQWIVNIAKRETENYTSTNATNRFRASVALGIANAHSKMVINHMERFINDRRVSLYEANIFEQIKDKASNIKKKKH